MVIEKVFEYFECPSNIGSASIKKKNIHAVNRLNMAACALMYPLRLYFGGWGLGMGDGDINPPLNVNT